MDTPGSDLVSDSTDSTTADSISDSKSTHIQSVAINGVSDAAAVMHTASVIDNDDSASDISMSAESEDEDEDNTNTPQIYVNPILQVAQQSVDPLTTESESSKKRKYPGSGIYGSNGHIDQEIQREVRKRLKPDDALRNHWSPDGHLRQDRSLLPAEIWHHIFTFTPPRALGILLRVNKSFNTYLDPSSSDKSIIPLSRSAAQILKPDAIWQASRRLFRGGMPSPLTGKSELDMWKLACYASCQFCGRTRQPSNVFPLDEWHPGPGENCVLPIWPFAVRSCGPCLQQRSIKVGDNLSNLFALDTTKLVIGN